MWFNVAKLKFPERRGVQTKKPLMRASMDILWNNTMHYCTLHIVLCGSRKHPCCGSILSFVLVMVMYDELKTKEGGSYLKFPW